MGGCDRVRWKIGCRVCPAIATLVFATSHKMPMKAGDRTPAQHLLAKRSGDGNETITDIPASRREANLFSAAAMGSKGSTYAESYMSLMR